MPPSDAPDVPDGSPAQPGWPRRTESSRHDMVLSASLPVQRAASFSPIESGRAARGAPIGRSEETSTPPCTRFDPSNPKTAGLSRRTHLRAPGNRDRYADCNLPSRTDAETPGHSTIRFDVPHADRTSRSAPESGRSKGSVGGRRQCDSTSVIQRKQREAKHK